MWHDGRLAVLDLETTGVDPETARIVTCAIGYVSGGSESFLANLVAIPDIPIPAEASAIHAWDDERVKREGRPTGEVLDIALGMLDTRPDNAPVCVFNARYDLTVLDREARRHGHHGLEQNRPLRVVDPLVIDKHLDRYRTGSRKLAAMCRHYNARLEAAHTAGADAIAAGRLAWRIAKAGHVIRRIRFSSEAQELAELEAKWQDVRDDLDLLHHTQIKWAIVQERSIAQHRAQHGIPHDGTEAWPLIPYEGKQLALGNEAA